MGFGRPKRRPKEGERDVQENSGRMWKRCVYVGVRYVFRMAGPPRAVSVGVRCVCRRAGIRGPFYDPSPLKPRGEVKSGNERREALSVKWHNGTV